MAMTTVAEMLCDIAKLFDSLNIPELVFWAEHAHDHLDHAAIIHGHGGDHRPRMSSPSPPLIVKSEPWETDAVRGRVDTSTRNVCLVTWLAIGVVAQPLHGSSSSNICGEGQCRALRRRAPVRPELCRVEFAESFAVPRTGL